MNVLKHSPKISDLTKRSFFPLNLSEINGKVVKKLGRAALGSVWDLVTCWLSKGVLKQEQLHTKVTTIFGDSKFQNN